MFQLFEQLSTSDGLLVLQVFGPITVVLAVLGICAAAADYKPLLLVVRTEANTLLLIFYVFMGTFNFTLKPDFNLKTRTFINFPSR